MVFPLLANAGAVKYAWNESILDSFSFYPNEPTLFYVISREKGQHLVTYRSDACFGYVFFLKGEGRKTESQILNF